MAAKSEGDVRQRLRDAAVALFAEHGYDGVTAAAIAARAGVTERTFFRHFPDKREVLFDGEVVLREALIGSIAAAPAELGALDTLFRAFRALEPILAGNQSYSRPRQAVIAASPALRERETAKVAALADALAGALCARGVAALRAELAARAGMAAFVAATTGWLDDPDVGYRERIDRAERELRTLATDG